jgi:hypothetical protein
MMVVQPLILSAPTTSYANPGGTGTRTGFSLNTSMATATWAGTASNLVDGAFADNSTDSLQMTNATFADGDFFEFQLGSFFYIDEVKLYFSTSVSWGSWKWRSTFDGTNFTDLNTVSISGTTVTVSVSGMPPEGTLYFRMQKVGAQAGTIAFFREVEFKIAAGAT